MARQGAYDPVIEPDDGDFAAMDNLSFHESTFEPNSRAPKKSIPETLAGGPMAPGGGVGNNINNNIGTDTTADRGSRSFLWSIHFYAQYFDVDTNEVLKRCWAAIYPRTNFLDVLDGNPDLYGPFWIATTVVMILFLTGTISRYIALSGGGQRVQYDFTLLSGAAGLIYGYTGIIPIGLWAVLKWFGSQSANLMECWSLYGYANLIWIPVALISWSPISILNYVFAGLGLAFSLFFILRNLYPVLAATDHRTHRMLLIAIGVLHGGLAVAIKVLFFANGSPLKKD